MTVEWSKLPSGVIIGFAWSGKRDVEATEALVLWTCQCKACSKKWDEDLEKALNGLTKAWENEKQWEEILKNITSWPSGRTW